MPPKKDWLTTKVKILETPSKGKGIFATEKINVGENVVIWGGLYVNMTEAQKARDQGKLVMQFDEDVFSVEDRGVSDSYFVNHSCEPNLWMKGSFTLQARRDIEVGEELTADYAMWETNEDYVSEWICNCGSVNCRHKITGKDFLLPELQEKYVGHFIPFINRKIKTPF